MMTACRTVVFVWGLAAIVWGLDAPRLAEKGMESYQKGELNSARKYFARAMRQAALQARKDWVAMAALNMADIELESGNLPALKNILDGLPQVDLPEIRILASWKRSQFFFLSGMADSALRLAGPLASNCRDFKFCHDIIADVLRMRLECVINRGEALTQLKTEIQRFKSRLPKNRKAVSAVLEALVAMRERRYEEASDHWQNAVAFYRKTKRLARMAKCLNFLALSQLMEHKPQKAIETNALAVGIYQFIGLETAGLQAYALNIFMVSGKKRLDEVKANLELISGSQFRLDLENIIKDYRKFAQLSIPDSLSGTVP